MSRKAQNASANAEALTFFTELARHVCGGQPLLPTLRDMRAQFADLPMGDVLADITKRIEDGGTLSDAMADHPEVFNQGILALVSAGETAGVLDHILTLIVECAWRYPGKVL